jgi:hypothetical protein
VVADDFGVDVVEDVGEDVFDSGHNFGIGSS